MERCGRGAVGEEQSWRLVPTTGVNASCGFGTVGGGCGWEKRGWLETDLDQDEANDSSSPPAPINNRSSIAACTEGQRIYPSGYGRPPTCPASVAPVDSTETCSSSMDAINCGCSPNPDQKH